MITIACIAGARPNFMKIAPILEELDRRGTFVTQLIHTGQHFSPEMSDSFFKDLGIREPDVNLGVRAGSPTGQTAAMMCELEACFRNRRPDLVLVVGDVNSTLAAALAAVRLNIPIAHVEAGLRSFDRSMPEEVNRVLTDAISDFLFVTERSAIANLRTEGISGGKVFFVGNVMIDTLLKYRTRALDSDILERLGARANEYALVTLHRPANVDDSASLRRLMGLLSDVAARLPVIFPVHPRTRDRMLQAGVTARGVTFTPPAGYLDFLNLMSHARVVLTDSGGIQEETTVLGVPCLTIRENTERPATIEQGTNRLAGTDPARVIEALDEVLRTKARDRRVPELWDGKASSRIVDVISRVVEQRTSDSAAALAMA